MDNYQTVDRQTAGRTKPSALDPESRSPIRPGQETARLLRPAPDLAGQVEMCCAVTGTAGLGTAFYEIFPDSKATLVFRFSPSACRLVLLGPASGKAAVEIDRSADYFFIRFRTGQTPRLVDISPSELIDNHVELTRLGGVGIDSLADHLNSWPDPVDRQRVMEELIRGCRPLIRDDRCRRAARLMEAHGGRLRVREIASRTGLHLRSLQRIFLDHLAMGPKRLSRLIRFRSLLTSLQSGDFLSLADLAQACGYTDQSHMIRDFKELAQALPGDPEACQVRPIKVPCRTGIVHRHRP